MSVNNLVPTSGTQYGPAPSLWGQFGQLFLTAGQHAIEKEFGDDNHERDTAGIGDDVDKDLEQMRAEINALKGGGASDVMRNLAPWQWGGLALVVVLFIVLIVRLK